MAPAVASIDQEAGASISQNLQQESTEIIAMKYVLERKVPRLKNGQNQISFALGITYLKEKCQLPLTIALLSTRVPSLTT
jgi:hypothetical protein